MTHKNTLKRFLMYGIVLVGVLFVGFMAYFFARNEETIALTTVSEGQEVYMNQGSSMKLPLEHKDPYAGTQVTVTSSNEGVVSYTDSTKALSANGGGVATITITTTNKAFGPFKFDILVGDGTEANPWYISSALQFSRIGKPAEGNAIEFTNLAHYELLNDINLSSLYTQNTFWTPIAQFYGTLSGEGYTINNLKIVSDEANVGLFGKLNSKAKVENVKFQNVDITANGSSYVGVVAGVNNGYVGKVSISGKVTSTSQSAYVGGVVGANDFQGTRPTINMVGADIILNANGNVGGLVGINNGGIIFNSYANVTSLDVKLQDDATPLGTEISFGGLVSLNNAIITTTDNLFRQASIKNSYAIVNPASLIARSETYLTRLNLLVYRNTDFLTSAHQYHVYNEYFNLVAQQYSSLTAVGNTAQLNNTHVVSALSMGSANTFAQWSDSVWSFDTLYQRPLINYENSYETTGVADPGNELVNSLEVQNAIKTIVNNLGTKEINYVIDAASAPDNEIVIEASDLMTLMGLTTWTPIGSSSTPFRGQLIVKNGYVVIKNLNITQNANLEGYYGFFGYMSGANTVVKNFKFVNVNIEVPSSSQNAYAGAVAGYVVAATLSNIYVDNVTIKNAHRAGFVVGSLGSGTIENVHVGYNFEEGHVNTLINETLSNVYMGGIAGTTRDKIKNVSVDYATITNNLRSAQTQMGGIAAELNNGASIENARNEGVVIYSDGGKGYFGGIAAFMSENTSIRYSYSLGDITTRLEDNETAFAGGVAGQVSKGASIKTSFAQPNLVKSQFVGGIAAINHGSITESYSLGDFQGAQVGGLTYVNFGFIEHSYTRASVQSIGLGSGYTAAGLTVFLPEGSTMRYIYSSANISSQTGAKLYAETRSYIRYSEFDYFVDNIAFWTDKSVKYNGTNVSGTLRNYIVVNYSSATVQTTPWGNTSSAGNASGFINTTAEDVKGNGASNPMQDAGFYNHSPQTWTFVEGEWPQLTNIIPNPNDALIME